MKTKPLKKAELVKHKLAAKTTAPCQPCPQTVNFFLHFDPDGIGAENLETSILNWCFSTGATKPFPLHLPVLEKLSDAAFAGNKPAAKLLVEIATHLAYQIECLEKQRPKIISEIARKQNVWPVVVGTHPGWERKMLTRFEELGLGQSIRHIDIHFRKPTGSDENYAARRWAKTAVNCINITRFYQRRLVSARKSVDEKLGQGTWKRGVEPTWVSGTKDLPDYSNQTRPKWGVVVRNMIREELPEFHERPEWQNQRNSCKARNRGSTGEIQNTILDDIIAALKTITPREIIQSP